MPLYNYECPRHGEFADWANLEAYDQPADCPVCGKPAFRAVSACYLGMDTKLRNAFGASERSAHEPRVVRRQRGGAIPTHDAHTDLSRARSRQVPDAGSHSGHSHAANSHAGHPHGKEGKMKTVQSRHPWLVRH